MTQVSLVFKLTGVFAALETERREREGAEVVGEKWSSLMEGREGGESVTTYFSNVGKICNLLQMNEILLRQQDPLQILCVYRYYRIAHPTASWAATFLGIQKCSVMYY